MLILNLDGEDGRDGINGSLGISGSYGGGRGTDGGDATEATQGKDGDHLVLALRQEDHSGVHIKASSGDGSTLADKIYDLAVLKKIVPSARGGRGGSGGNGGDGGRGGTGFRGANATQLMAGTNGGPGGRGGDGGRGSDGKDGGRGGSVTMTVSANDMFLLMAVEGCDHRSSAGLVRGGVGGSCGFHGHGGMGGFGGAGGAPYSWTTTTYSTVNGHTTSQTHYHSNPGGINGPMGISGSSPTNTLTSGQDGENGSLAINIPDMNISASARYDLRLENLSILTNGSFSAGSFEFGDTAIVQKITVQNVGPMPTPPRQRTLFRIKPTDPYIRPRQEDEAFIPMDCSIASGDCYDVISKLNFTVGYPDFPTIADDFEPFIHRTNFLIRSTQLGLERGMSSGSRTVFQRDFLNFHLKTDHTMVIRFPVENVAGIVGLRSLASGESTSLQFAVRNIGRYGLGLSCHSTFKRFLGVQVFLDQSKSDIDVSNVKFVSVDGKEANISMNCHRADGEELFYRGHLVEISSLATGSVTDIHQTLSLSPDVLPYSRLTLQAEVILQDVPRLTQEGRTKLGRNGLRVIQRRKIEVVSEPAFGTSASGDVDVVLVSTLSTTRAQYISWMDMVQKTMGLRVESFSASRYGHLEPNKVLPNGTTLRQAFADKLVIVLNEKYSPIRKNSLKVRPSRLLPRGCSQGSGFEASTRWLIVGSSRASEKQLLAGLCRTTPDDPDTKEFASISKFRKHIIGIILKERASGQIEKDDKITHYTINATAALLNRPTASKRIVKLAESLRKWLSTADPLRQYLIEHKALGLATEEKGSKKGPMKTWSVGSLTIHRGQSRCLNRAIIAKGNQPPLSSPPVVASPAMLFSVAISMPATLRIQVFCQAVRSMDQAAASVHGKQSKALVDAFKDAFASELLWEVANHLDGNMNLQDDPGDNFPSVATLGTDPIMQQMVLTERQTSNAILKQNIQYELSDLIARLKCIADSKDLRPVWALKRRSLREALCKLVGKVAKEWGASVDSAVVEKQRRALKSEVKSHIKKDRKKYFVGVHSRWRKGLNFIYSTKNSPRFSTELTGTLNKFHAARLIELEIPEGREKRSSESMRFATCVTNIISSTECKKMRKAEKERMKQLENIYKTTVLSRGDLLQGKSHEPRPVEPLSIGGIELQYEEGGITVASQHVFDI